MALSRSLRDCISAAYDEVIEKQVFETPPLITGITTMTRKAGRNMETVDIIRKAREEKTKDKVNFLIVALSESFDAQKPHKGGDAFWMEVTFPDNARTYHYAVTYSGERWYTTNQSNARKTEEQIDEMIRLAIESESFEYGWYSR